MAEPTALWFTDRSRLYTGLGRCPRERYLRYHSGPTGYGIVHRSESVPLATGGTGHTALERLFKHLAATDAYPGVDLIRQAILEANRAYLVRVEERGYRGLLQSQKSEDVVAEQMTLVAGMVWGFCRTILPWIHTEWRILQAEEESLYALSDGLTPTPHTPIVQMIRQDVIAEHRTSGRLAYLETKTTGWAGDVWASQWETKPQLPLGSLGIREKFGRDVDEFYIVGLYKGRRVTKKDAHGVETAVQDSPFTLGYLRPGNPPLGTDDWLPAYEWTDEATGELKKAPRAYQKAPLAALEGSDWPIWRQAKAEDPSLSVPEFWASWLPQSVLSKQVFLVGPMLRNDRQVESLKRQIVGEELRWQDTLWKLYEDPSRLDELVPASYDCRRYGTQHQCEYVLMGGPQSCFGLNPEEDPIGSGKYVPRLPHHQPELDQAVERGLLPEQAEAETEEE